VKALYVDLDGTLLGRRASLLHDAEGEFSLLGVRALEACSRVGAEVVIYSGRRRAQVFEDARLIGQESYIFEAGAGLVLDGELQWLTGGLEPSEEKGTIHEQISASGAPVLLLDHYSGRLEYHAPWHTDREVSHLFRGHVDALEADALLERHGHGHLRLVDNGNVARREYLTGLEQTRAYHLVPAGASKANAVATHMRARAFGPEDVIAVGDSREDMGAAGVVGTFWLVANALEKDPTIAEAIAQHSNVRVAEERNGAGVYEAVVTTLAERRG
jgi:hydroxymethylpyrimidine pyrophosphatase-like HAD family hydrolase